MADGPNYSVAFRRRRKDKTSYKKRFNLLKSGKPRAVIRLTNTQIITQIVAYSRDGDETLVSFTSQQLEDFGWEHAASNIPAAYLTGYACGLLCLENSVEDVVADLGMQTLHKGGKLFAAVKGLQDAGVNIPVDEDVVPEEYRLTGGHIADFKDLKVPENVETVKEALESELS